MQKVNYLSSLTSLRGIAALLVIIFHFDAIFIHLAPYGEHPFFRKGYLWVDFFFLLSGFIMMHVYGQLFVDGFKMASFKKFIRARFARIYPLYLFSFFLVILVYLWFRANFEINFWDDLIFDIGAIPTNLLLLQSMHLTSYLTWNQPSWSVAAEWWIYLLFPFMIVPFKKIINWRKSALMLFILGGYFFIIYYLYPLSNASSPFPSIENNSLNVTYDFGFIRCFFGFLFGMLLYELYSAKLAAKYFSRSFYFLLATIGTVFVLGQNVSDLYPVLLFAIIVLMGAYATGLSEKLLNLKPLQFLGEISYSMYLIHIPLLFFISFLAKKYYPIDMEFNPDFPAWTLCWVFVALVIIISAFTYHFIEVPARKKINPSLHHA